MLWKNSRMDYVYWGKREAKENLACEVRIDGKEIVVTYEEDDQGHLYSGEDLGGGHFRLSRPDGHGDATLHQLGDWIVEGYWHEQWEDSDDRGFWRITLED